MLKIIYFIDYASSSGNGHLSRCLTFSKVFPKESKIYFVTEKPIPYKKKIMNYIYPPEAFLKINKQKYDYGIIDSYQITHSTEKKIKKICKTLVTIDDFKRRNFASDIILNYSPLSSKNFYHAKCGIDTKLLLGDEYNFLRLIKKREKKIIFKKRIDLFIYLGTKNRSNIIKKTLSQAKYRNIIKKINVVGQKINIRDLNSKIKFYKYMKKDRFIQLMSKSDILIISSGVILHEASCLSKKIFALCISANQKKNYNYYKQKKIIRDLDEFKDFINLPLLLINKELKKISEKNDKYNYNKIHNVQNKIKKELELN